MQTYTKNKQEKWKRNIGEILFITLVLSIIYAVIKIIVTPSAPVGAGIDVKIKGDYVLMLLQCILGLVVMTLPIIIERRRSINIPDSIEIVFYVFLFLAIFLGEVRDFYYLIPYWDTILHALSGLMLGALGFSLVGFLNHTERLQVHLSPFFVALFSFCFALAAGVVWEIYEYVFDGLLQLNMQKYALAGGIQLVGHVALSDTMTDIIIDAISALIISAIGYYTLKKSAKI